MGKYSKLGRNTLLVFIGNIGSKLISFIMLPFYTTWLAVIDYGITDIILIYTTLLSSISTLCLTEAIFIFPKGQTKETQQNYFSSGFFIGLVGLSITATLFYIIKSILSYLEIHNAFIEYYWVIYLIIFVSFLQSYTQQFSRSLDKVGVYAISGVILTASTAILSFLLIPRYKLNGYFISQILSFFISATYTFFAIKAYKYLSVYNISNKFHKEMLGYSIPLIPNVIMWWIVSALNRPIMEKHLGLDAVGLFAVANKFPGVIALTFSIFTYSWQISVIEEFSKDSYSKFYNKMIYTMFIILILLSCGLTIFSDLIVQITLDAKFRDASKYIPILSLSGVFSAFSGLIGANFSALRKSKYYFYSSVWGATASITLSLILIPLYGIYGACIAVSGSFLTIAIFRLKYSWQYVQLYNIYNYIIMLLINILLILCFQILQNSIQLYSSVIILIVLFGWINKNFFKKTIISIKNS